MKVPTDRPGPAAAAAAVAAAADNAVPSGTPVVDADVRAWLDHAVPPEPADMAAQARVKKRLLRRIAAQSSASHLTLPAHAGEWRPFGPGVTMKVLHQDGERLSYLLRLAPGAALPAHRHPVDEECLVLEGEMHIGNIVLGAGGFHLGRRGVLHDRLTSPGGALIYLRGAVPEADLAL